MWSWFCEWLPRLHTISVCIEPIDPVLHIATNGAGDSLVVRTASQTVRIGLPAKSVPNFEISADGVTKGRCLVFKLPGDDCEITTAGEQRSLDIDTLTNTDNIQWSAKQLRSTDASFQCAHCQTKLIDLADVRRIDAMPSEFWSEMMDFWHCHRPAADNVHSAETITDRFNRFRPKRRSLIVGSSYIVLNPADFGIATDSDKCVCSCDTIIGGKDPSTGNYRVDKWKMVLARPSGPPEPFEAYLQVYTGLLDAVSSTAIRYYIVEPRDGDERILVWVFNFGLKVSLPGLFLDNALKILYKDTDIEAFVAGGCQYDTLTVDREPYTDFKSKLIANGALLPEEHCKFNEWNVSYLGQTEVSLC